MIKVSVCMITYNHQEYILKALSSILNQECDFLFEIIISNDCSTDSTNDLITNFINENNLSKKIKYFDQKKNLGITPNFIFALNEGKGKYIAICEGDDYWIDPLKLQKQVDFLDNNHYFSAIATNSLVKYEGSKKEHLFTTNIKPVLKTNELLGARHFHTATFMFKKEFLKDDFPKNILSADRTLFLLISCFGPIQLLEDVTAVYRKNEGGISRRVTSKQMKLDYKIANYIKKHNQDFNYNKLIIFITTTVLDYSFKIYFLDFVKASCNLILYNAKEVRGFSKKLKSIKQSLLIINDRKSKLVI